MIKYAMCTNYYTCIISTVLCLALVVAVACSADAAPWRVLKIVDGDSLIVVPVRGSARTERREEVRLIGIDAPEIGQRPWGIKAKKHLRTLIGKGGLVELQLDTERHDRYGRLLAYAWASNGAFINERMVADGYALAYTVPPNVKHAGRIAAAQKKARQNRAGLWKSHSFETTPQQWRQKQNKESLRATISLQNHSLFSLNF